MGERPTVLVLGGGPDAERAVSLESSSAVARGLESAGYGVRYEVIDRLTLEGLGALAGDVVFPLLHGPWGEGGPLQSLCERDGRPFVGCGSACARHAMDKIATKLTAASMGVDTPAAYALNEGDEGAPMGYPFVVKPVHEGSTIGLFVCRDGAGWRGARASARGRGGAHMVEAMVVGREVTCGVVSGRALPLVEIAPSGGLYDYAAKYERDDTSYIVGPVLAPGVAEAVTAQSTALCARMGCSSMARADWIVDGDGRAWFLEVNTTPGFTSHSLLPMGASAVGMDFPSLCSALVEGAMARDGAGAGGV